MELSPDDVKWLIEKLRGMDVPLPSKDPLKPLLEQVVKQHAVPGEDIVYQGKPGQHCYLIKLGLASVWVVGLNGRKKLATLQPGDFFGEMSALGEGTCNATVTAEGHLELFAIPGPVLQALMRKDPRIAERIEEIDFQRNNPDRNKPSSNNP